MATTTLKRDTAYENVFVKMPQSDMAFFRIFSEKMGWLIENKKGLLWDNISKIALKMSI